MTAKPLQRDNDDFEVLKFKDFRWPLTSNSKLSRSYSIFKVSPSLRKKYVKKTTVKNFKGPLATPRKITLNLQEDGRRVINSSAGKFQTKRAGKAKFSDGGNSRIIFLQIPPLSSYVTACYCTYQTRCSGHFATLISKGATSSVWILLQCHLRK